MPTVSIIIPVYNVEKYLGACLDSVLAQTFPDFEAVCINDGSTDGCGEILKEYALKDNRIKIINQANQGLSMARNQGLKKATGKYVCFLDSDDELSPVFLEKMHDLIETTKSDIVSCNYIRAENAPKWDLNAENSIQSWDQPFDRYMQKEIKIPVSAWGKLYTRPMALKFMFDSTISCTGEDLLYQYQCLYAARKVSTTSLKLYFYRDRPNSTMTSKLSERFVLGNIRTACLILAFFKDKELSPKTLKIINRRQANHIFKFGIVAPMRQDKEHLQKWYDLTRPILKKLYQDKIYKPQYLNLKNRIISAWFLGKEKS